MDFSEFKQYSKIVVSGPQRSGTNLVSKVLCEELGYTFIDEEEFGFHFEKDFMEILKNKNKIIMQAPGMSHILHKLTESSACIVFCLRDPSEIMQSQHNLNWTGESFERQKYTRPEYDYLPIGLVKYIEWFFHQRSELKIPYKEIYYNSFKNHKLWINKENRKKPERWAVVDKSSTDGFERYNGSWCLPVVPLEWENQKNIEKRKI
jgi:hypothetical protein